MNDKNNNGKYNLPNEIITALEIDHTSNYIAVGYSNGSIAILKLLANSITSHNHNHNNNNNNNHNKGYNNGNEDEDDNDVLFSMEIDNDNKHQLVKNNINNVNISTTKTKTTTDTSRNKNYKILLYFQAHDSQVIQIQWLRGNCSSKMILSSSVSSTKYWRIQEPLQYYSNQKVTKLRLKRTFEHIEIFNLNSISLNSDGNTFLSSDEFRIYLWDLNQNKECFNIIDLKPNNIQLLNEIIRVSEFHPKECNLLIYGTSRGSINLCDMRESALVNSSSKVFGGYKGKITTTQHPSIFSSYLDPILDLKFSYDGRLIASRTLDTLSIWDIAQDSQPLSTVNLYNESNLLPKLYDMHESSAHVDRFQCRFLSDNKTIVTGSYDQKSLLWEYSTMTDNYQLFTADDYIINDTHQLNNIEEELGPEFQEFSRIDMNDAETSYHYINSMAEEQLMRFYIYLYYSSNQNNIHFIPDMNTLFYNHSIPGSSDKTLSKKISIDNLHHNKINNIATSAPSNDNNLQIVATSSLNQLYIYSL
ncbi:hypothetical protein DLAC_08062 [Tieghemostelium lacteum]|uniref:Serine/threonine-protein phosphatase 2A 55 kDa regulatory subunit B n=1 Tax=Tieghemostelium lacteum TaxID=361077 RepID=A0A151ZB29_TIELA|nr:hypothetical protein DLAC_08062 [Tieghemostelium lacteum]|eukprot:KYQ91149.1 hypothetical protein DLAC_08062 [Tieghemostelium lacteum]